MTKNENLKKRIIYRSNHRGTKEMDLLLGKFVKVNINKLSNSDLKDLEKLIQKEDDVLKKWFFEKNDNTLVPLNRVSKLFKQFKF